MLNLEKNPIQDANNAALAIACNPLDFATLKLYIHSDIKLMVNELGPKIQQFSPTAYTSDVPLTVIQLGPSVILSFLQQREVKVENKSTLEEVVSLLHLLNISDAMKIAAELEGNTYSSVNRLAKAPEGALKECGLKGGDLQTVLEWQRDFLPQPSQAKVESQLDVNQASQPAAATRSDRLALVSQHELQILDDKTKESWQIFLYFVYNTYPPGPDKTLFAGELNAQTKKSALLLAIEHFHPDKVADSENHTVKFLHEEITKRLNQLNRE